MNECESECGCENGCVYKDRYVTYVKRCIEYRNM